MQSCLLNKRTTECRRGATLIVTVFFLAVMLAFVAMVVDLGYLANARAELQRTADAAAMAACWDYADQLAVGTTHSNASTEAYGTASTTAGENQVCRAAPSISTTDVTWGRLDDFYDRHEALDTSDPSTFNAVRVSVRRTASMNGRVPFFFAKAFGVEGIDVDKSATAAIVRDITGFETPSDGSNLGILPIALDEPTWNEMLAGIGTDDWTWNEDTQRIQSGSDGVLEINLYPHGNLTAGNRGTVDIGSAANSTQVLARQITDGLTAQDMSYHDNKLEFDANGELILNGDTGISAGIKDELASIKGKPRVIPLFNAVNGPGNNAQYTIIAWCGIRIMDVKLTGNRSGKRVVIQAATMAVRGAIPGPSSEKNFNVFSPVVLVR